MNRRRLVMQFVRRNKIKAAIRKARIRGLVKKAAVRKARIRGLVKKAAIRNAIRNSVMQGIGGFGKRRPAARMRLW